MPYYKKDGDSRCLKELTIKSGKLQLTTDRNQRVVMNNNTEILLPNVNTFTEIHLFFDYNDEYIITLPPAMYQTIPKFEVGCMYELIFTYVDKWMAGIVKYSTE